jgi:D-alanyl-D-alanine carboxypeptidase
MKNIRALFLFAILIILIIAEGLYIFESQKKNNIKTTLKSEIKQVKKSDGEAQVKSEILNADSLLVQIDKQHCLPTDYAPQDLVNISNYNIPADKNFQLRKISIPDLVAMIDSAKKEGIDLKIISAYRSYQDQERIYKSWVDKLGAKEAARQSAPAGCSQHELGTAVDFNELNDSFSKTLAGIWLSLNSLKYGWAISYPANSEDITGYIYEPWHYRYIGIKNADEFKKSGLILSEFLKTKN